MSRMSAKKFVAFHLADNPDLGRVRHALYRETGTWFHLLERFPAALCDEKGYVIFETKADYLADCRLQHGVELTVPNGIASHPRYVKIAH